MNYLRNRLSRRSMMALPFAFVSANAAVPRYGAMERISLDLGHRATRSGPIAVLGDGTALWITTEPEPPYLAKAMWPISRVVMRRSQDNGRSWGEPRVLLQGTRDYSLLSHALRVTTSGALLHIFVRYSGYDYESASPAKSLSAKYLRIVRWTEEQPGRSPANFPRENATTAISSLSSNFEVGGLSIPLRFSLPQKVNLRHPLFTPTMMARRGNVQTQLCKPEGADLRVARTNQP
jgi:hypothetical protein